MLWGWQNGGLQPLNWQPHTGYFHLCDLLSVFNNRALTLPEAFPSVPPPWRPTRDQPADGPLWLLEFMTYFPIHEQRLPDDKQAFINFAQEEALPALRQWFPWLRYFDLSTLPAENLQMQDIRDWLVREMTRLEIDQEWFRVGQIFDDEIKICRDGTNPHGDRPAPVLLPA